MKDDANDDADNGASDDDLHELSFRLNRDLRRGAETLTVGQARFLVDTYYQVQQFRIEAAGQRRASVAAGEPVEFVGWLADGFIRLEASIKSALDVYSDQHVPGRWAKSVVGIGPVIAAGLLAHIDVGKAKTAGAVWRFAGLDPTQTWDKGKKRPWNARLKVLAWKIGESFVKQSGREGCVYGQLWAQRKALEVERNEGGTLAEQAAAALSRKRFGQETQARRWYEQGKLPPAHVHARAKRWAVKLFLAHYHHVAYEATYGAAPPKPYVISILGHGDYVAPPNWPMKG